MIDYEKRFSVRLGNGQREEMQRKADALKELFSKHSCYSELTVGLCPMGGSVDLYVNNGIGYEGKMDMLESIMDLIITYKI
jgi:hypothetical protein